MIEPGRDPLHESGGEGTLDRLLGLIVSVQTPLGLLLVVAGFLAVFLGWLEASGTADVRIQMQDLISGGVGGLGLLVIGGVLLQSALADRAARRTEVALQRLADALEERGAVATTVPPQPVGRSADVSVPVMATHASFHRPDCDLLHDRVEESVQATTLRQAKRRGLAACRVCLPGSAGA